MESYDVFVSYSRKDEKIVHDIINQLEKEGFTIWYDINGIESGDAFKKVIVNAIKNSKVVLFISSVNSNKSTWTAKEIALAIDEKKPVIPLKLDDGQYNDEVRFDLINSDYIDYRKKSSRKEVFPYLVKTLRNKCNIKGPIVTDTTDKKNQYHLWSIISIIIVVILIPIGIIIFQNSKNAQGNPDSIVNDSLVVDLNQDDQQVLKPGLNILNGNFRYNGAKYGFEITFVVDKKTGKITSAEYIPTAYDKRTSLTSMDFSSDYTQLSIKGPSFNLKAERNDANKYEGQMVVGDHVGTASLWFGK